MFTGMVSNNVTVQLSNKSSNAHIYISSLIISFHRNNNHKPMIQWTHHILFIVVFYCPFKYMVMTNDLKNCFAIYKWTRGSVKQKKNCCGDELFLITVENTFTSTERGTSSGSVVIVSCTETFCGAVPI